ncbi:Tat pathway signal protein [Streptomyces atriruber]|uniref:Tat pathway signal protein n=1 Tax=Streptomyces atriruber TaxID=545121 RepID=UPI000A825156|nr:Tat pathway signal protein [Streptomyces atriruber]
MPSALPATAAHAAEPECAPLALAPFGDPGTAVGKATVAPDTTTCYTFTTADAGLHLLSFDDSSNEAHVEVHQGDARVDCYDTEYRVDGWCKLSAASTYTLKVVNSGWEDAETAVTVVPLGSDRGCAPKTGTNWDQPTPTRTSTSPVEIGCQPFDAEPGDRIRLTRGTKAYGESISWITDATGARICTRFPEDEEDSCVLPGKGPYRALSRVTYAERGFPAEYAVTARRLNDPQGCPSSPVRPYGPLTAQDLTTTPCFTVTAEKAGTYRFDSLDKDGDTGSARVHDRSGKTVCRTTEQPCRLPSAGTYTAFLDGSSPFHDTPRGLIVLDRAADRGCVQSDLGTHKGELSTAGQYDCLNLPAPKDARIAALTPLGTSGVDADVEVLDSEGTEQCEAEQLAAGDCALTGPAPYRALVHADGSPRTGPYTVAVHRTDAANDCPVLPAGSFAADGAKASFATGDGVFSRCLTIPADAHTSAEALQLVATSGDVPAKFSVLDSTGKRVCDRYATTNGWTLCALTPGKAHTVLVTGRDQAADYTLTRRDVTSTASSAGCAKAPAGKVGGPSLKGTSGAPGTLRCHQVTTPAATDVVHLDVRDALGTADLYVLDGDGDSECEQRARACAATGSTTHQVLVQTPSNRTAAPEYRLDALRIATADGPAAECAEVPSVAFGYGPVTGTLDETHTATCATLPTARGDRFEAEITDTTGAAEEAVPALYNSSWKNGCSRAVPMDYLCDVNDPEAAPKTPSVLVLGLPDKASATSYSATLKCRYGRCGGETTTVTGVTPTTAAGGSKPTLTVTGTAIAPDATVRLTQSGRTLTAKTKSVSADYRTLKAALDLTDVPAGTWHVSVSAGGSSYDQGTFTVTEPELRNTTAPKATGTATVGSGLTADRGTWTGAPSSYTYQWKANGEAITGATASTYKIPAAHLNKKLTVTVTAHKPGHRDASASSAPLTIAKGTAPKATTKPSITGTTKVGKTLKTTKGTWSPAPTSYSYQWYANGTKITGATKSSLTLKSAHRGKKITLKMTAHRTGHHSGTSTSNPTPKIT